MPVQERHRPSRIGACATILILACLLAAPASAQNRRVRFLHLTPEEGLSQVTVRCLLQDSRGYVWIGTDSGGLNRYDGRELTVYKHDPDDERTLSGLSVRALAEDARGRVWVGTSPGGLDRFDPVTESFRRFGADPGLPGSLGDDRVYAIQPDDRGRLWVGTERGLYRFSSDEEGFEAVPLRDPSADASPDPPDPPRIRDLELGADGTLWIATRGAGLFALDARGEVRRLTAAADTDAALAGVRLSSDELSSLFLDHDGSVWVGTYDGGLNRVRPGLSGIDLFLHDPDDPWSLSSDDVRSLLMDEDGTLWIGTQSGLDELPAGRSRFVHHRSDVTDPRSLSDDQILTLLQDRGGVIWVGTHDGGLNRFNPGLFTFELFEEDPRSGYGLHARSVLSVAEDAEGRLWVGTAGGGLNRVDRGRERVEVFLHDPEDSASLGSDVVTQVLVDAADHVWTGSRRRGLSRLDPDTGGFDHFAPDPEDPLALAAPGVMRLYEDRAGVIWVGLFGGGLDRWDPELGGFVHHRHDPEVADSIPSDHVASMLEADDGSFWVGTDQGGLALLDRESGGFQTFRNDPDDPTSLSSDRVWSIAEAPGGDLWIATGDGGIQRWRVEDRRAQVGRFERFDESDGLASNSVYGILVDDSGVVWASSVGGLSRLDTRTSEIRNYGQLHGLVEEFYFGCYYESDTGELFFGGVGGLNAFQPDRVRRNRHVPELILTDFRRNNQSVLTERPLYEMDVVEVGWRDYLVSFEFAALDFTAPEKNQYAYKLVGFDKEWIELGTRNRATFTNLPGGSYTLEVRGSNNDGVWNEEGLVLGVTVIPPPWRRWWAYGLYSLALMGAVMTYTGVQRARLRREGEYARRLEVQVAERTAELADKNRQLAEATITDALTGLRNRYYLLTEIQAELDRSAEYFEALQRGLDVRPPTDPSGERRHTEPDYMFLAMDLDGFKPLNDTHGHAAGDQALVDVARILHECFRESDSIIRWGGDEFMVICRNVARSAGEMVSERVRKAIESHAFQGGGNATVQLHCSIGYAFYPFCRETPLHLSAEQVLNIADRALYVSKSSGRNGWVGLYSTERTIEEADLLLLLNEELDHAVERQLVSLRASFQTDGLVLDRVAEPQRF